VMKTWPAYFDPGDVGVQVRGAIPVLYSYDGILVKTLVIDDTGLAIGDPVEVATLTDPLGDTIDRAGLQAYTAGRIVGYVQKLAAASPDGFVEVYLVP
jgi:hypothetical protein